MLNRDGFAREFPPEAEIDLTAIMPGKGGREARWVKPEDATRDGFVDLGSTLNVNFDIANAHLFDAEGRSLAARG